MLPTWEWVKANGGPLAIVILGIGITGFTYPHAGIALIVVGLAWWAWPHVRRSREALTLKILDADWEVFQHTRYIVALKVQIRNHSNKTKQLMSLGMSSKHMGGFDNELSREIHRRQEERGQYARLPSRIEPRDTVVFWHITQLGRLPGGGRPGFELGVKDEMGDDYVVTVKPRPARRHVWGSSVE